MAHTIPPRFLFRWSFAVPYLSSKGGGGLKNFPLEPANRLPSLQDFDGGHTDFADIRVGWNEQGLAISVEVSGKQQPLYCDPLKPRESDGLQLWLDTRCTQTVHRATRFCHHCILLPQAKTKSQAPSAHWQSIAQAREQTGERPEGVQMFSEIRPDGYLLGLWFSANALFGFDPASHPRLGFYALVNDSELGSQPLTVGSEFPYEFDPSLWQTLELSR